MSAIAHAGRCLTFALLLSAAVGCATHRGVSGAAPLELAVIDHRDPADDLNAALARGDKRFVGLIEVGRRIPGPEMRPELVERYCTQLIAGTSDTADPVLMRKAYQYAEVYNLLLLWRLNEWRGG